MRYSGKCRAKFAGASDNLKSGVNKASFYDPEINRTYGALTPHYGVGVLPRPAVGVHEAATQSHQARTHHHQAPQKKSQAGETIISPSPWRLHRVNPDSESCADRGNDH
ncbi:MAG: hypothetical protein C3F11_09530 [Methylocystaceae bacterium]|nr:MAG: hypothetical protein C3F11_09530 [Methylocystaceae bacterium]